MKYTDSYMQVKKGQFLIFTSGEYSDYGIHSTVKVLKDFNVAEQKAKYERDNPDYGLYGDIDRFISELNHGKYVEEVGSDEIRAIHLGSYGELNLT